MTKRNEERAAGPKRPDLDERRWSIGAVAWSREGDIVILDPKLRRKLASMQRQGRKVIVGFPPAAGASVGELRGHVNNDPFPIVKFPPPLEPKLLELCVCPGGVLEWKQAFLGRLPKHFRRGR